MAGNMGVIGAGSWGTALAIILADNNHNVELWCYDSDTFVNITDKRENSIFLPGFSLSKKIIPTEDFASAVSGKDVIVWVVPTQFSRRILDEYGRNIPEGSVIVNASKGIENETFLTPTGIIEDVLGNNFELGALSGPSFAKEVAEKQPTAVMTAFRNIETARKVQIAFSSDVFRVYAASDVIGAELGGALKNVIAIAAGVVKGLGYGHNTLAGLITRGLAEITRFAIHKGAERETMMGLAGMGDLVLTCTGGLSRNLTVGKRLGEGEKLGEITDSMDMVAEGVKTAKSVNDYLKNFDIEMPIAEETYKILYENKSPSDSLKDLMGREPKLEIIK